MNYITNHIAFFLSKRKIIDKKNEPIYAYGAEIATLYFITIFIFIIVGILSGQLLDGIIFTITFMALRNSAGGFHASTRVRCFIISVGIYIVALNSITWIPQIVRHRYFLPILIISNLILLITSPTQNLVNLKTVKKMKENKRKLCYKLFFINIASVFHWIIAPLNALYFVLLEALVSVTVLSLVNLCQNYIVKRRLVNEYKM